MRIGIDIDEVLSETLDFAIALHHGKIAGIPIKKEQVTAYYLPEVAGFDRLTPQDTLNFFAETIMSECACTDLQPVVGAYSCLKYWKTLGHQLYAITARGEPTRPNTEQRINLHYPQIFSEVIFCNHYWDEYPTLSKEEVCKNYDIPIFVEDNAKYAQGLAALGIKVFLLKKPRNEQINLEDPSIIRVADWNAIPRDL